MNFVWLWDFIFQAWCDGVYLIGNIKFSWVECWEYFDLLENCWWNLIKILDERDTMFGLVWLFGFGVWVFKPRMDCDHKVSMVVVLLECDIEYYWTCFDYEIFYAYHCLWLAYPYLFVCVFVACAMII